MSIYQIESDISKYLRRLERIILQSYLILMKRHSTFKSRNSLIHLVQIYSYLCLIVVMQRTDVVIRENVGINYCGTIFGYKSGRVRSMARQPTDSALTNNLRQLFSPRNRPRYRIRL